MKIVADENITDVTELFSAFGEVLVCPGRDINADLVANADALLVRSITSVDHRLLVDSKVGFVGSATIGTDHIDLDYLSSRSIEFAHAPGCNANAVVQYVIAVLCGSVPDWRQKTVGIIGCGHVGGQLLRYLQGLGVNCKVYDPLLDTISPSLHVEFFELMSADVICVHTPLTHTGPFPTYHMIDRDALDCMAEGATLINAGRGAVIDNRELLKLLESGSSLRVVLDVWEDEPNISLALLDKVLLGTPHIAGHSIEGKLRGTQMLLEAFCRWRKEAEPVFPEADKPEPLLIQNPGKLGQRENQSCAASEYRDMNCADLESAVLQAYNPGDDFKEMKKSLGGAMNDPGQGFDALRRNYKQRWEFSHYEVDDISGTSLEKDFLTLGFQLINGNA